MADVALHARDPLAGLSLDGDGVSVRYRPFARRWSLRADPEASDELAAAWGAALPDRMLTSVSADGRHALRLGPDEWLLLADAAEAGEGLERRAVQAPFSLVDVSDRGPCIEVSGQNAPVLLNAGIPLDLSSAAFPAAQCSRTVFGKVEVVLWRPSEQFVWRLEVWRSFADYVTGYLTQALADL